MSATRPSFSAGHVAWQGTRPPQIFGRPDLLRLKKQKTLDWSNPKKMLGSSTPNNLDTSESHCSGYEGIPEKKKRANSPMRSWSHRTIQKCCSRQALGAREFLPKVGSKNQRVFVGSLEWLAAKRLGKQKTQLCIQLIQLFLGSRAPQKSDDQVCDRIIS